MPCTTILVGKEASFDGSNMIARNDDSGAGSFTVKKYIVVEPDQQPRTYTSVISHCTIELPDNPMRYTCFPSVDPSKGVWGECGVNAASVAMTATETITSNSRVLGADPLVEYDPATGNPGGIGEEDLLTIVLPYVKTAREGVIRLGQLLEQYGTYEMNGIAFSDPDEIWWLESIGGHHWIARRVPDDCYVVMPNQFGLDAFDFDDAFGDQKEYMCSADLKAFVDQYHLDLSPESGLFNPRLAFGSHDDSDHVYNTPRSWYMERYFNPHTFQWDGADADFRPDSDDIPWCLVPEKKITVEDVKYILSSHFQGTPYDPYLSHGNKEQAGAFRPIGINRNSFLGLVQQRPNQEALIWIAFASNTFNAMAPYYALCKTTPEYLSNTTLNVNTDNCYWTSRLIGAMADASYSTSLIHIERYQNAVMAKGTALINHYDALLAKQSDDAGREAIRQQANQAVADMMQACSQDTLNKILYELSCDMKNSYSRSDA